MKLRNIFLASLAVCTMASCSKDDDINKGPAQPVDAQVSFGITTDAMTKAGETRPDESGSNNENFVETLTALIFDTNDKLVGRKDTVQPEGKKGEPINKIEHVTIKVTPGNGGVSTETFKAVLIANAKDKVANVTKLSDLEDGTAALDLIDYSGVSEGSVRLPMASKTLKFEGVKPLGDNHTENWIYDAGSGIEITNDTPKQNAAITLYRLVARIDLEKVNLDDKSGINFILTRVFLANVAAKSPVKYLTSGKNPLVETPNAVDNLWKGFQSAAFDVSKNLIIPGESPSGEIVGDAIVKPFLGKYWGPDHFDLDQMQHSLDFGYNIKDKVPQFYIFAKPHAEDNKYDTRLVLEGLFKRTENSPAELRHFHVVLNKEGQNGVMANYIYKLTVTITGEGSPNEDEILLNAHISSKITVAPWNVIEQDEDDTN